MGERKSDVAYAERIRALEKDVQYLDERLNRFESYCKDTQLIFRESFQDMNTRIEDFLNHEVTELKESIKDAKNTQREPLSRWDWTKILVAIITVAGTVAVALIIAGII